MRQLWPAILLIIVGSAVAYGGIAQNQNSSRQPNPVEQQSQPANQPAQPMTQAAQQQSAKEAAQTSNGDAVLDKALEDELYNKENELGQAERDRNAEFFEHNLAPDFLYVAFNGLVLPKDKIVDALQHIQISSYEIRNVKFRRLGPDVVQLAYDLTLQGDAAGVPLPHQMYATSLWVKSSNDWRLAYHQTTPARHH